MRPPRLVLPWLRAVVAAVAAVLATLVGAANAFACSLPPPFDGEIRSFRLVAGPGSDRVVAWQEVRRDGPDAAGAATLNGGTWAWADPASVPTPGTPGLPYGAVVDEATGNAVAVWQQNYFAASRAGAGAFGPGQLLADEGAAPPGGFWTDPTVSLGGGGHAIALWTRSEGSALMERLRISRQKLGQPICALRRQRARRACRMAGAALTFRLSDAAEVRVTVQRRGRGKAIRGVRLAARAGSHRIVVGTRPLPPGRYTVRIRVTATGRAPQVATKQLEVLPA